MSNSLPVSISPCPIQEAVVEIRFSTAIPPDAVFGILYAKVKQKFTTTNALPILQIPEAIRSQDPNLTYQPHYMLSHGNLNLKIGPKVIGFSCIAPYVGWEHYFSFVTEVIEATRDTGVIERPERLGLRYINYFPMPVLDVIDLGIQFGAMQVSQEPTYLRTEFKHDDFDKIVSITNNMSITLPGKTELGSLLDIDCVHTFAQDAGSFYNMHDRIINQGHEIEKQTFFKMLKPDFLATLDPKY